MMGMMDRGEGAEGETCENKRFSSTLKIFNFLYLRHGFVMFLFFFGDHFLILIVCNYVTIDNTSFPFSLLGGGGEGERNVFVQSTIVRLDTNRHFVVTRIETCLLFTFIIFLTLSRRRYHSPPFSDDVISFT